MRVALFTAIIFLLVLSGCGKDTDIIPDQRNSFVTTGGQLSRIRRGGRGLQGWSPQNPPETSGNLIAGGDSVYMRYPSGLSTALRRTSSIPPSPAIRDSLKLSGLNTLYWPNSSTAMVVGTEGMTKALRAVCAGAGRENPSCCCHLGPGLRDHADGSAGTQYPSFLHR